LVARQRALELAYPLPHRTAELRQALRPEDDQGDHEDDGYLGQSYVWHLLPSRGSPYGSGARRLGPDRLLADDRPLFTFEVTVEARRRRLRLTLILASD